MTQSHWLRFFTAKSFRFWKAKQFKFNRNFIHCNFQRKELFFFFKVLRLASNCKKNWSEYKFCSKIEIVGSKIEVNMMNITKWIRRSKKHSQHKHLNGLNEEKRIMQMDETEPNHNCKRKTFCQTQQNKTYRSSNEITTTKNNCERTNETKQILCSFFCICRIFGWAAMARRNGWERYFVTKYKATSNLIWSVLRSANAHFFLVFYRFLFRFYVYILGLVWIPSKMRGDSLSHSRAARTHTTDEKSTREHIQISNKWRRSRIYMHALLETKNRIAIFALHLHCSHLDQCSTELCSGVFFSFHSCLWCCCCWLESSRSLTIWFIATYIFRFDCLCSIKFADKIQSNCSNISRSLSSSLSICVFGLVRLHICFAHLFSFVAIFRKSLPNGQHTRSKSICAKTTKSGMHHFVGLHRKDWEREREKELAHRPSSISNRWKCNIDKNKSKLAKRIRNEAVEKLDYTILFMTWNMEFELEPKCAQSDWIGFAKRCRGNGGKMWQNHKHNGKTVKNKFRLKMQEQTHKYIYSSP